MLARAVVISGVSSMLIFCIVGSEPSEHVAIDAQQLIEPVGPNLQADYSSDAIPIVYVNRQMKQISHHPHS